MTAGAGIATIIPEEVFKMIEINDIDGVKLAVEQGFEINKIYGERANQKTVLLESIRKARPEIVKYLLDKGADTELKTNNGYNPLMASIFWSPAPYVPKNVSTSTDMKIAAMKIFDLLIEYKADVNYCGTVGGISSITPLGFAASLPYYEPALELSKKLLKAGAEVNPAEAEKNGRLTPLFWAVSTVFIDWEVRHENRIELIKLLLEAGANPNAKLGDGDTLLHYAIVDYDLTKMLLEAGGDEQAKNKDGKTPYEIAIEKGNSKVSSLLLDNIECSIDIWP
jgi:ankyrin repeat protein